MNPIVNRGTKSVIINSDSDTKVVATCKLCHLGNILNVDCIADPAVNSDPSGRHKRTWKKVDEVYM